jgi:CBS-domain-containing membrane protein
MNNSYKSRLLTVLFTEHGTVKQSLFAAVGGFIAIACIAYLAFYSNYPLVMGSFGASCVLLFGFPESPFSQPKNIIAGHLLSTFIGLCFLHFVGPQWWSMALALSIALGVMIASDTVHPPAGSNPLIVFLADADWSFLFLPSTAGSVILVLTALFYINLFKDKKYPKKWV